MLTARDRLHERTVRLPDFERGPALEEIRERARDGQLVCATCGQSLWLRAGEIRIPHFGHRTLSDCPQGRVSEAVLNARLAIYRFFRARIEASKLPGEIELEPQLEGVPPGLLLDLLLHRPQRPWVAVFIVEGRVRPDTRSRIESLLGRKRWLFRPVFLERRLKRAPESTDAFLLDTTMRDFRLDSPYDLPSGGWRRRATLHFVDAEAERWTTLRGLSLVHEPQVFEPGAVRVSSMQELLWSEVHGEWAHPGEAESLKAFVAAEEEKKRQREAEALRASQARAEAERRRREAEHAQIFGGPRSLEPAREGIRETEPPFLDEEDSEEEDVESEPDEEPELPAWITDGLKCVGCGQRTKSWQNASPGQGVCVCRDCFASGTRLPS